MKNVYKSTNFLDERALSRFDLTHDILLENAAGALESLISRLTHKGSVITILCGSGDNGADGYALARRLSGDYSIRIYQVKEPKSPLCVKNYERACECQVKFIKKLLPCDVVVDCVFGSGFKGVVEKPLSLLFAQAYRLSRIRIACDLPSGIQALGIAQAPYPTTALESALKTPLEMHLEPSSMGFRAFKATHTLCMGAIKLCALSDDAKDYVGELHVANLGLSSQHYQIESNIKLLERSDFTPPHRQRNNVHKWKFGLVGVIYGEKSGAAILSAQSALCFGAGLSTLIAPIVPPALSQDTHHPSLFHAASFSSDAESEPLSAHTSSTAPCAKGFPAPSYIPPEIMSALDANAIAEQLPRLKALCVGMGLGRAADTAAPSTPSEAPAHIQAAFTLAHSALSQGIPCVIDADAFHSPLIKNLLDSSAEMGAHIVLTPHLMEFEVLLRCCHIEPRVSQIDSILTFSETYPHTTLLLKGANVYIAKDSQIFINPLGSQALAKAGSGDVLSGLIAALLAQGRDGLNAAIQGSLAHTLGAEKALHSIADYALTPSTLMQGISHLNTNQNKGYT